MTPRYRAARCEHGMMPGLCVVLECGHFDGIRGDRREASHTPRAQKPIKCQRCKRRVPRETLANKVCAGGCFSETGEGRHSA